MLATKLDAVLKVRFLLCTTILTHLFSIALTFQGAQAKL